MSRRCLRVHHYDKPVSHVVNEPFSTLFNNHGSVFAIFQHASILAADDVFAILDQFLATISNMYLKTDIRRQLLIRVC